MRQHAGAGLVAAAVTAAALLDGLFEPMAYAAASVLIWVAVIAGLVSRTLPVSRVASTGALAGTLLAAGVLLSGLSLAWAGDQGRAFDETVRASAYLGLFVLAALTSSSGGRGQWLAGLAAGFGAVSLLAVLSHLQPGLLGSDGLDELIPDAAGRLSEPVGYWNGAGALFAVAGVLVAWWSTRAGARGIRAAAAAILPVALLGVWLTTSRGGSIAVVLGLVALLAAADDRGRLLVRIALGCAAAIALILVAEALGGLDAPASTPLRANDGDVMTLVLLAVLCATAAVAWLADGASVHLPLRGRALGAVGVAAVVAAVVAIIAADPADRWEDFTAPPADLASPGSAVASDDLGSSGRWQFWGEALEAFESRPITGIGAGAFEDWWAQNATIPVFVRNPHSLGLQQLSELGIAGFLLFAAFAGTVAFAAWRRLRTAPRGDGSVLVGVLAASAVGTAVDWTWAIPAVIAPGIAAAAMLTASTPGERRRAPGYWLGLATLALGWVLAVSGALLTLGELKLEASRQAAGEERFDDALNRADEAETVMPWSSEPRLQLALVLEERREVGAALDELAAAGARDEDDWRIPYIESRLLLAQGDVAEAYAAYERARSLAPLSPVFRGGAPQ